MSALQSRPSTKQSETEEKATLFCPGCDHQDHYLGDWATTQQGDALIISCPYCLTALTARYRPRDP